MLGCERRAAHEGPRGADAGLLRLSRMTTPSLKKDFLNEMRWRGLIHQCTGEEALADHLASGTRRAYVGFDPTADSLTIGNLVGIMALVRFAQAGHEPIIVAGGGTGMIGDPSGKSKERELQTIEKVQHNVQRQRRIFDAIWSAAELGTPPIRNNYEWLKEITFLEMLRDIGKHFSVNMMIQKESVKERLTNRDQGISYTEFSYMILQAYDFAYLCKNDGVTIQMGGSDQFGNIASGLSLINSQSAVYMIERVVLEGELRNAIAHDIGGKVDFFSRTHELSARIKKLRDLEDRNTGFGLTWPLVTKADGTKFGKTESGAIWLTADRTSPFAFYQFWLNTADADMGRFLRTFTLLSESRIKELDAAHAANPGGREAHRALAQHMTTLLHGAAEAANAEKAAKALFSGEIADLPLATLEEVLASAPSSTHDRAMLAAGVPVLDALVTTKLAESRGQAKEFLGNGSVTINGRKIAADHAITSADLLHGTLVALRRGKKNWHVMRWA